MADQSSMGDKSVSLGAVNSITSTAELDTNQYGHLTLWQSIKKWRRVVLYCIGMTSAILLYGYDYVIVGTVSAMPSFQRDFGQKLNDKWILPSLWLGLWNFVSPGCSMVGALVGGIFQDRFGRRASLAVGSFLSAVGVAVCFISNLSPDINERRGIFLAGKGFQGGAIGMVMATSQTYMSEILPPNLRGPLLAFFPIFTLLGQLIGAAVIFACLNLTNGYTICFASQWPFSAIPLLMAFIIPESPTYLIRRNQDDKAYKAQKRLAAPGVEPETTLDIIRQNIEHERRQTNATYIDSFRGVNLRRTLIVMFANSLPNFFGLTLLSKSSYFVQVVGMKANLSVIVLILGLVCGLIANIASVWILSKIGRRKLITSTLAVLTVIWTAMGIAGCFSGPVTVWYTAMSLIAVVIVAGLGVWPASHVVGAETSALHLRSKAQGIGWFTAGANNSIFGFVLPYIFNPDKGNLKAKTGFVYAGLCALGLVVSFLCIPEMKGRTPAEIDRMFESKLPARKFRHWVNSAADAEQKSVSRV
ncbi:maltose permease (alpha glucoside transporter) [Colletotrichum truncatum]|uniref:Maltose permease (Alpha glucoside transporter) n=1 Tax=Colletotrichum truncatum TaxID=5467 RepID=A0ACC3ZGU8_COLTU|nr:maltose permease (alpha glucoside transporter) [Colletotrichum truncatum]KAF6790517.1 maltose permease (alpha glucoside transporter) [Colletotrichum truncatum]